jgi:hypothetical protein
MGPCRNTTTVQAENIIKLGRHNMRGSISKNTNNVFYTIQYPNSYFRYESNNINASINNNNKAIITTAYTLTYTIPTCNILRPVVISNYTNIQKQMQQFELNYTIHSAKKAGFVDRLKEHYTKCRLIAIFQSKGNYLLLNEIVMLYFKIYHRSLVYEEKSLVCIIMIY